MEENENKFKSKIKKLLNIKNKAFYIALSVCLTCVGGAAFSSINSWNQFNKPKESMEIKAPDKTKKENPFKKEANETKEAAKPAKPSEQKIHDNKIKEQEKPQEKPPSEEKPKVANSAPKTKIVYPTNKNVLKKFSGDTPVFSETMNDWRVHNGIDLGAEKGSAVKSITSGKIQSIKNDEMLGKVVIIEHSNGVLTSYCGLEEIEIKEGENVTPEQTLGKIGIVPSELKEDSHLHLTMQKDGKYINPIDILGK